MSQTDEDLSLFARRSKTARQFRRSAHELERAINHILRLHREQQYVTSRWLDQVLWMDRVAERMQFRYYTLRLITIIGGVTAPALFSMRTSVPHRAAVVLSLIVGISAAVDEFFHYGERWRHYRATTEQLKAEGWRFLELSDDYDRWYGNRHNHEHPTDPHQVYPHFVEQVERIIGREVHSFLSRIAEEDHESKPDGSSPANPQMEAPPANQMMEEPPPDRQPRRSPADDQPTD